MSRHRERGRRRQPETGGSARSPLPGRVLRGGQVGYYPCTVVIAGVPYPCVVLEWAERDGVPVARIRYAGPDGEDRLTTVDAQLVTVDF